MIPRWLFFIGMVVMFILIIFGMAYIMLPKAPTRLETKAIFKKRYFIVTYDTGDQTGTTSVETNDGLYFSLSQFKYDIGKTCAILFVQELSKEDYDKFWSSFTTPQAPIRFAPGTHLLPKELYRIKAVNKK